MICRQMYLDEQLGWEEVEVIEAELTMREASRPIIGAGMPPGVGW